MPSHKIHLAIAKTINDKINNNLDYIMLGSVLPDLSVGKEHKITHYQIEGSYEERLANPDKFIQENKDKLNNPIIIGYLIHILTDRFYNNYFFKKYCIFNDKNDITSVKLKNGKIVPRDYKYKQGDFVKYDKWLLKHNKVYKFNNTECFNGVEQLFPEKFDIDYLKNYVINANKEVDNPKLYSLNSPINYRVMDKNELDKMYEECIDYILNYLSNNNILDSNIN